MKRTIEKLTFGVLFVGFVGTLSLWFTPPVGEDAKQYPAEKIFPDGVVQGEVAASAPVKEEPRQVRYEQGRTLTSIRKIIGTGSNDSGYGSDSWYIPDRINADDADYASLLTFASGTSNYLKGLMNGNQFALGADKVIDGIEVEIQLYNNSGVTPTFDRVRLVKGGTVQSTDRTSLASVSGSETVVTFGGPSDKWGDTWTVSDINSANFGAVFSFAYSGGTGVSVDYVAITVYYHTSDAFVPIKHGVYRKTRDNMWFFRQSTASQEIPLGPFIDETDGATPLTGLTISASDIQIFLCGASSYVSKNSGGATHTAAGNYIATMDATDTSTVGSGEIRVHKTGALPIWVKFIILHANIYDWWFGGTAPGTGSALDAAGVRAAVGLASANLDTQLSAIDDYVDTEVAAIKAKTDNLPSDPASASTIATAFSTVNTKLDAIDDYVDTEVAAIKAKTDQLTFTVANKVDATATLSSSDSYVMQTGTAAAGAATTITIATALGADTLPVGCLIKITSGTGANQCRTITGYVNGTKVVTVDRPWTTTPDNTSVYAILYDNSAVETVCRAGGAFTSSAGTEVRISAWLERNGQAVTSYASGASCTVSFRENGSGSDLFSVTDTSANGQGVFEVTQSTPGYTSDRGYVATVAITEGGNTFTTRHPVSVR